MFSKSKKESYQEAENREQYEYAQERIKQKKGLLSHLIYFVVGAIILALVNLVLGLGKEVTFLNYSWYIWVIVIWGFLFLIHVFNVFVKNRFMGNEWEHRQLEKLKSKQEKRLLELQEQVEKETQLPDITKNDEEE